MNKCIEKEYTIQNVAVAVNLLNRLCAYDKRNYPVHPIG